MILIGDIELRACNVFVVMTKVTGTGKRSISSQLSHLKPLNPNSVILKNQGRGGETGSHSEHHVVWE